VRRSRLAAQHVSKNTEFDIHWQDLEEILHLLRDRPSGTLVRLSKTRAMFAKRACRKSTIIGEPLNEMTTGSPIPIPHHMSPGFFVLMGQADYCIWEPWNNHGTARMGGRR